jgi:hypothetical protein
MKLVARFCLICCLLFTTTHRAPAPIVEEEKSTPVPAQSEAPKPKHSKRSTTAEQSPSAQAEPKARAPSVSQGPARFAGTWSGKVNQGLLGHVQSTLTVDANAASVELSHNLGGSTRSVTINGNTISWKSGVAGEISWTLTPNSDGQTAQVTMKGLMLNETMTFRRGQTGQASSTTRQNR